MINMDFTKRLVLDTNTVDWQQTGIDGVTIKPLAIQDDILGHLTAMIRYNDESIYTRKERSKGEELLVLAGTFSANTGDYPTGTYYRNPRSVMQMPFSQRGCIVFAKLNQVSPNDEQKVVKDVYTGDWIDSENGVKMQLLCHYEQEQTLMVKWPKGYSHAGESNIRGAEVFIISGELIDDLGSYKAGTWLRTAGAPFFNARADKETVAFVKYGHLPLAVD